MTDNWGERRLAQRKRRLWRVKGALIAAAIAFPLAIDWLGGAHVSELHDGATVTADGRPLWVSAAIAAVYIAVVFTAAWFGWRNRDEVERAIAIRTFAVIGFASIALHPILKIAAPLLGIAEPGTVAWSASLVIGLIAHVVARTRG